MIFWEIEDLKIKEINIWQVTLFIRIYQKYVSDKLCLKQGRHSGMVISHVTLQLRTNLKKGLNSKVKLWNDHTHWWPMFQHTLVSWYNYSFSATHFHVGMLLYMVATMKCWLTGKESIQIFSRYCAVHPSWPLNVLPSASSSSGAWTNTGITI